MCWFRFQLHPTMIGRITKAMREVQYLRYLDGENRLRIRFELERGQVASFVVQLECEIEGHAWLPIVRYDTAHGFAHRDKMHPYRETEKTEIPTRNFKQGLTFAIGDMETNWQAYRRRHEEWLKK